MKIIRWWGLAVFFCLLLLITLCWYLLAPYLIKTSIEDLGSEILGAKVEVTNVELTLFPLSLSLNRLVATNPDQPMENLFDSEKITFALDTHALLWKKFVIEEMILTGLKTATQRQTSGALVGGRKSTQAIQEVVSDVMPDLTNIDVKQLVDNADLLTLKRITEFKSNQSKIQDYWKTALDKDAFEKRIESINSEYTRLSKRLKENKLNFIKDKKDWSELKKAIDSERKQIADLSTKLAEDKTSLSNSFSSIKNGPNDDKKAIMEKLGITNGVEGLLDKYIGPQYTPWINKAVVMIKGFKRSDSTPKEEQKVLQVGEKVYFNDQHIFPELLIKKILISGSGQSWSLDGNGADLGYLPWLTSKPAKLNIDFNSATSADKIKPGKAKVVMSSDWPSATKMLSKFDTQVNNWPVNSFQLMQTEAGDWILNSGSLNATINGEFSLEKINFTASLSIDTPRVSVPDTISGWQKTLAQSINNEAKINFKLAVSGNLDEPKIKLYSSLENLFKNAIGAKVKEQAEKLSNKVKQTIIDKVGDISTLQNFEGNFAQWQSHISDNDNLLKAMLDKIKL